MIWLLVRWLVEALALLITAKIVPGFRIASFTAALIAVLAIGLLSVTVGVALKLLAFPFTILTLGLFLIVINAILLKLAGAISPGFAVETWSAALIGAVVLALLHLLFSVILT